MRSEGWRGRNWAFQTWTDQIGKCMLDGRSDRLGLDGSLNRPCYPAINDPIQ